MDGEVKIERYEQGAMDGQERGRDSEQRSRLSEGDWSV
jgi:hypothetical protein